MNCKKVVYKVLSYLLIVVGLCSGVQTMDKVFASELSFYNHNAKKNVNYTGKQVSYIYNNKRINLTYPGIIIDGIALADYEELFVNELGLSATISDKNITFINGETELVLTLNSKTAKLNGTSQKMSVAPIKLEFSNGITKYYVPTRFVAEAFGYNYVWNSQASEVKITKTLRLAINEKTVLYSDTLYSVIYKETPISLNLPVISYKNTVYAPAKFLFEALGCQYQEELGNVLVGKDDISLQMSRNSYMMNMKDISFPMSGTPLEVSVSKSSEKYTYIPLEDVIKLLGFNISYNPMECNYLIMDTEYTGNPELHPELKAYFQSSKIQVDQEPITTYFLWSTDETPGIEEDRYLTKVRAYSIENADVIELYGISKDNLNSVIDNNVMIFELKSVKSNMNTQFYSDFDAPHLQYALLTTVNNVVKLVVMIPIEDEWVLEETEDCLKIYFMSADVTLDDLKVYEEQVPELEINNIKSEVDYPENQLVFPVPEGFDTKLVKIQDNYLDKNIQIILPGNFVDFYRNTQWINPYDFVAGIDIVYNDITNQTIITVTTEYICGFEDYYKDTFFSIYLAKPTDVYNKIVVLDAGHGGKDPGANREDIYEKDINLSIVNYTEELFKKSDIKVYCTRTSDKYFTLQERIDFVHEVDADLFVSLHINASELTSVSGTEVYYCSANNNATEYGLTSKKLAQALANNLYVAMDSKLRGVINNDYYVLRYNSVPAALIELGFISNKAERAKLVNKMYQQESAQAIFESIIEIFTAYPTGR